MKHNENRTSHPISRTDSYSSFVTDNQSEWFGVRCISWLWNNRKGFNSIWM